MILAVALSALVLIGWQVASNRFFPQPVAHVAATPAAATPQTGQPTAAVQPPGIPTGGTVPNPAATVATPQARAAVLAASPRIRIVTPKLSGSINLKGARFDDLELPTYRETLAKESPAVRLLSPADAYFGQFGWTGPGAPPADALWTASAQVLTPETPVTLSWTSPSGAVFEQVVAVDKDFMFTVRQRIRNSGAVPVSVRPWGLVSRLGEGTDANSSNLHSGPVGVMDGHLKDSEVDYSTLRKDGPQNFSTTGGWLGITEKYWLAALIPDQHTALQARFASAAGNQFQTDYLAPAVTAAPGGVTETVSHFFAGAKEVDLLDRYMSDLGIPKFDLAVSWGWFKVLAQPIFKLLSFLFHLTGNFGLAIIGLTLCVRAALFPIAQKQFGSMAKMRVLQPKLKALQERFKDDKVKLQSETMALYKTEKVNPVAGCLPLVIQIPIFYALYKTMMVSIEMRHQPFILWIKDLSAPDPLTPVTLFGLIPWNPPAMIALGVLPILLGITMWLQQRLNPTPMDPAQKQIFALMPWVFMFIMAPYAAGLQLYWTTNNLVSIAQQWYMTKKYPMPATPPGQQVITAKAK